MHRLLAGFLLLCGLFHATVVRAADSDLENPPAIPKDLTELKSALDTILRESKTPGMAIAIATRDEILLADGLGLANVANAKPADADTMFRIGSTSKAFVAFAALKLVREGKLDLHAPIFTLAPEIEFHNLWETTDPVRVVHLLEHTAGFEDMHYRDFAHEDSSPNNLESALAWDPDSRTSRWRPGTRMAYCNSGPAIVARIIEKIVGIPFEDYVDREFFQPIGMVRSSYFLTDEVKRTQATLYRSDGVTPYSYWHIAMRPAGAINSSAREMAKYVQFYLNRGKVGPLEVLTSAEFARMETPQTNLAAAEGLKTGYGLYNYSEFDDDGFLWRGHSGGVLGGASDFSYLPDHGIGYSLLVNAIPDNGFSALSKVVRSYITQHLTKPKDAKLVEVPVRADLAAEFAGFYVPISPRDRLLGTLLLRTFGIFYLQPEDNALICRSLVGPPRRLVATVDSPRLLRRDTDPIASLALLKSSELGAPGIVIETLTLVQTPLLIAFAPLGLLVLSSVLAAVSLLFLPIWGLRRALKRLNLQPHLEVRLWPLASSISMLSLLASMVWFMFDEEPFANYASINFHSLSLAILSVLAVVSAGLGLLRMLALQHRGAKPGLRWLAITTLAIHLAFALFLLDLGVVPFVTWN